MQIFRPLAPLILLTTLISAQEDVDQCALDCIANVNGTSCSQAEWSCLCKDRMYIERVNNCTYASCDKADEDTTFGAVAQMCQIFGVTLTYGPEATASTSSDGILSTLGVPSQSSLPAVLSSTMSEFPTGSDGYTIATAPSTASSGSLTTATPGTMTTASSPSSSSSSSPSPPSLSSSPAAAATSSSGASKTSLGLACVLLAVAKMLLYH